MGGVTLEEPESGAKTRNKSGRKTIVSTGFDRLYIVIIHGSVGILLENCVGSINRFEFCEGENY